VQRFSADRDASEAWLAGPWNSALTGAFRLVRLPREEPHYHRHMREICLIISGRAELMVKGQLSMIDGGTLVIVEAGEVHAWHGISRDCQMLVLHDPWDADDLVGVAAV
jgi:mannose-6-phosphate isomerase-like protein (cupin superfamily)